MPEDPTLALYVHLPFCQSRCTYCDFNTYAGRQSLADAYLQAVVDEAALWSRTIALSASTPPTVRTLFLGGGTPSVLSSAQLRRLLDGLRSHLRLAGGAEVSMEANPSDLDEPYLRALLEMGINRLSLGVQSFREEELRLLGRRHSAATAALAYVMARRAGFENLSLDLIYGLPGQSLADWQDSLERALDLGPDHLSLYALTLEEGTLLEEAVRQGHYPAPDPDLAADMYTWSADRLPADGYSHYEISNWARTGCECRHNLVYWRRQPYLGLGAGAHSCLGHWRFSNLRDPADYAGAVSGFRKGGGLLRFPFLGSSGLPAFVESGQSMARQEEASEALVLALRLAEGVDQAELARQFGAEAISVFAIRADEPIAWGLLLEEAGRWRLSRRGQLLSNQVFAALISDAPRATPVSPPLVGRNRSGADTA